MVVDLKLMSYTTMQHLLWLCSYHPDSRTSGLPTLESCLLPLLRCLWAPQLQLGVC